MTSPVKQAEILADTLYQLWNIPTHGRPCHWPLETRLRLAANNVASGKINAADAEPHTFGNNGSKNLKYLLRWLIDHKPEEAPVITRGDFCLPNTLINNTGLTGLYYWTSYSNYRSQKRLRIDLIPSSSDIIA